MAIYSLHVKIIGRSKGHSAVAAAAYRATQKLFDHETGETKNHTRREQAELVGILAPQDAPSWVYNRETLWNSVQKRENRINSQFAREFTLALPVEFSKEERQYTVEKFCAIFTIRGLVCDYAIHNHAGKSKPANPYAHVMVTTRTVTKEGWGIKDRDADRREFLLQVRKDWEFICNVFLPPEKHVSCESLEVQGIERSPTQHMGRAATAMERRYKRKLEKIAQGIPLTPSEEKAKMPDRTREITNEQLILINQ